MAYIKTNWIDDETAITADRMNNIETGIENVTNSVANIIDSGTNNNGTWIKYSNGTMICTKTVTGTAYITEQYYNYFYHTPDNRSFDLGDFAQTFIERPICNIIFRGGNTQWIGSIQNQSASHIGDLHLLSVTSKTAGAYYDIIAIGRWK